MDLREEPVYPNEISEIVNWKTLIPMIGVQTLIYILVGIALLVAVIVYLELKHPYNLKREKELGCFNWKSLNLNYTGVV